MGGIMNRDFIVIGNWKMHKTAREAADYVERLSPLVQGTRSRVFLSVPYTSIAEAASAAKSSAIVVGAQNMNEAREGAFTGEVSAIMLKEAGARFVLLGHSERRYLFDESDEVIHRKMIRALQDDLLPVLCIGETAEQRAKGKTEEVLQDQLMKALEGVSDRDLGRLMIAYEPVWAIGSGNASTPQLTQESHSFCRKWIEKFFGKQVSQTIPLLYGGSVKALNVKEIATQKDVDGVLVGEASLDPEAFSAIIQNCEGI